MTTRDLAHQAPMAALLNHKIRRKQQFLEIIQFRFTIAQMNATALPNPA
jgi:hypothetical protein